MTSKSGTTAINPTRGRILGAANRLFGALGYTRATTRAIAAEAGVNEVTLFRHFGSTKNLLKAVIQNAVATGFAATFRQQLSGDYAQDIALMADAQMASMVEGFQAVRLLMCDAQELPEVRELMLGGVLQNLGFLTDYFQGRIDAGDVRSGLDAGALARAFDALFSTTVFMEALLQPGTVPEVLQEVLLRPLVELFVQGSIRN